MLTAFSTHVCLQLLLLIVFHSILLYCIALHVIVADFSPTPLFNFVRGALQIPLIDWLID